MSSDHEKTPTLHGAILWQRDHRSTLSWMPYSICHLQATRWEPMYLGAFLDHKFSRDTKYDYTYQHRLGRHIVEPDSAL